MQCLLFARAEDTPAGHCLLFARAEGIPAVQCLFTRAEDTPAVQCLLFARAEGTPAITVSAASAGEWSVWSRLVKGTGEVSASYLVHQGCLAWSFGLSCRS